MTEQQPPKAPGYSVAIGTRNRNGQVVIAKTELPGSDYGAKIYILGCEICGFIYGANGADCWLRRCPNHDKAKPGEQYRSLS